MISLYKRDVYLIGNIQEFITRYRSPFGYALTPEQFGIDVRTLPSMVMHYVETTRDSDVVEIPSIGKIGVSTSTLELTIPPDVPLLVPQELLGALRNLPNTIYTLGGVDSTLRVSVKDVSLTCYTALHLNRTIRR